MVHLFVFTDVELYCLSTKSIGEGGLKMQEKRENSKEDPVSTIGLSDSGGSAHVMAKRAREVSDYLVAVSRISAATSGLTDLNAILPIVLNTTLSLMDGVVGGIMLLDNETGMLSYCVHHGLSDKYTTEMRLRPGEGVAGQVAQSGRPILLDDISSNPNAARLDLITTEGIKAFVSIPLRARDNVLGVLNVGSHRARHFTTEDLHLLGTIGDQLGIAIEHARLYERLAKARERYRQVARQVLLSQEEERKRVARELHDETSQSLTGLALTLQVLIQSAEAAGVRESEFKATLERAHSLTVQISSDVSRLIANLRPTLLDTLGLFPAIRRYAETNLGPLGVNVYVEAEEATSPPEEVEVGLFRWAQGAIGNIMQHSEARNVTISCKREDDELVLRIRDDGRGFNVSEITGVEETGRGAGLFSMKERMSLLGGHCTAESRPRHGTVVTARVPIFWSTADAKDTRTGSG